MLEATGNLWTYPADIRVITTNGTVKKNGECVMGRGCAAEAKTKYSTLAYELGCLIKAHGNHVHQLSNEMLFSFPVKHNWYEKADLALIERSMWELVEVLNNRGMDQLNVVMPRPGCGNGGLKWSDVKPILESALDDRFTVITFGEV